LKIIHAQYCVTCQVSKVTRVKSLSESQFGPYICYFYYISVHFLHILKNMDLIETKRNLRTYL